MAEVIPSDFKERSDLLYLHFDVEDHFIKLDTFIRTAESARGVFAALDETLFRGSLQYELIVTPPETGTFLTRLAVYVTSVAAFLTILDSDVLSGFSKGLTGKSLVEWAQATGEKTSEFIAAEDERPEQPSDISADSEGTQDLEQEAETAPQGDRISCQVGAQLLVAMTKGVLEKDTAELQELELTGWSLINALEARAEFYLACYEDDKIERVGFTADDDFPIPRNSFPERAQKPRRKEDEEEEPEWIVLIENIYATSPNWDKDDQKSRQWKGKDSIRRDCFFIIDDEEFWQHVTKKDLRVEGFDRLKVQWAYQLIDGKPKKRRVIRVLEFNEEKLSIPLSSDAIRAVLGRYRQVDPSEQLPSLFSEIDERW